jgi:hypothetical protein
MKILITFLEGSQSTKGITERSHHFSVLAIACIYFHRNLTLAKEDKMGWACSKSGEEQNCLQGLARKYAEKKPSVNGKHKLEDNIKMNLNHVGRIYTEFI